MTLIFGHRGSKGTHPENTMPAFEEARRARADGIELDVQLTKDGEVVIFHDEKVNRTTDGSGYVWDLTLKELKRLNAGAKFQNGQYKAPVPTLEEFFCWFKQSDMLANIELKNRYHENYELEEKTVYLIKKFKMEERVILSSFNHYSIVYCYRLAPEIETAPLFSEKMYMPWIYAEAIRAKGIHPHHKVMSVALIEQSQKYGIRVRPYTVNKKEDLFMFMKAKTSAVITDFPGKAVKIRNQLSALP